MSDREALRAKTMRDSEESASKPRFALFGYPPPLFMGEGETTRRKTRNEEGRVLVEPKNVQAGKSKVGVIGTFSNFEYTSHPFIDHQKVLFQQQITNKKKELEPRFKPQNFSRSEIKAAYPYMSCPEPTLRTRGGRSPRNITSITARNADELTNKHPEHMSEPHKDHKPFNQGKGNFKNSPGGMIFQSASDVYNIEAYPPRTKAKLPPGDAREVFKYTGPNKKGWKGTFQTFPQYRTDNGVPRKLDKSAFEPSWKPRNPNSLSRPTPSIAIFKANVFRGLG